MKLESLVIVNQHVTVNDLSNFAHTAHHARRIVSAGHYLGLLVLSFIILGFEEDWYFFRRKRYHA